MLSTNKDESESNLFSEAEARQSHMAKIKSAWASNTLAMMSAMSGPVRVDWKNDVLHQVGEVVSAAQAVHWPADSNVDVRPRLFDKASKQFRLIDSGSMITATKKLPGDKIDHSTRLIAVNGSQIQTYGTRQIEVKIGRKAYSMDAIICDISQDILGADFINRYRLGLEWDSFDQSELYIVDKKANIKELLQMVTVPTDLQRVHSLASSAQESVPSAVTPVVSFESNKDIQFQVACMKKLDSETKTEEELEKEDVEKALLSHDKEYVDLLRKYPRLLNPSFPKGEPVHGVYHRIETGSEPPCRAKRRPIIMDSEKAKAGKKAWDKMIRDGVVERVKAGSNTE